MDIDETVLDNSPYLAALVRDHKVFEPQSWQRWVLSASAQTIPGAKGFITRARQPGYAVVFISNRNCDVDGGYDAQGVVKSCPQKQATLDNLAAVLGYRPAECCGVNATRATTRTSGRAARKLHGGIALRC